MKRVGKLSPDKGHKRSSIFGIPLVRELAWVLVIKLVVIFVIKWQFFSDPVDMSEPTSVISEQLGITAQPYDSSPSETSE